MCLALSEDDYKPFSKESQSFHTPLPTQINVLSLAGEVDLIPSYPSSIAIKAPKKSFMLLKTPAPGKRLK